ncbi:ribbon-helix-helix protein, CopG family [Lyngbya sp. CCY1209]|uniref:ribbon-helix-helix protein, CopG family n=1 Tax=Lyngbya sp. CCY1209 TaxID=2886103 RepID=UPI002D20C49C|nr:ribbon-helix-helix protein, CopG family [Lyngbya sp. CCY1209]MEB3887209.1 ribbon-helix-helix protein, CopG family [Lyngbya sp. CCY1209]
MMSEFPDDRTVNIAIPQEWVNQLQERSRQTGRPISELLREAVGQYLAIDILTSSPSPVELELLKREVSDLRRKLFVLEKTAVSLELLESRVATLERRVGWGTVTPGLSNPPVVDDDDEEIYDEPDEILTDFLPD